MTSSHAAREVCAHATIDGVLILILVVVASLLGSSLPKLAETIRHVQSIV